MTWLCRIIHAWGRWGEPFKVVNADESIDVRQQRSCRRCGAIDVRTVTSTGRGGR